MPERDREKGGLIEVRGRLMNLKLNNGHGVITSVEPVANTHFFSTYCTMACPREIPFSCL